MDSYAEFLERLKEAAASLTKRQTRLNHVLWTVGPKRDGPEDWVLMVYYCVRTPGRPFPLLVAGAGKQALTDDLWLRAVSFPGRF